ncbi:bifunctional diguanylate cyclase/phosphodiesterase [Halopseudomonas salegens]|uniref:cyclic-guanylate-specific phosphodiesterase n=1 Tax=Halopseudomonas salegens TaxID=1434072 RepID=A0A1H2EFR1_9GAMM|nr:EAL domain-containing protein [Halopseudomonas salegens]SDT93833.1 PAS domain S-box-containing protein/diguanylate cyclase (GGDEF) domain-containing protein [Halopseudomonas salegens]
MDSLSLSLIVLLAGSLLTLWLLESRRRRLARRLAYQQRRFDNVFNGVGLSLFLFDLSALPPFLQRNGIADQKALDDWLTGNPLRQHELVQQVQIIDANPLALQLFGASSVADLQRLMQRDPDLRKTGARYQLILAVLEQRPLLELNTIVQRLDGAIRYVWMVMRLPARVSDYRAVPLSLSDITERRKAEKAIKERERFWASVVKAVPDVVFVRDVRNNQFSFSNRPLAEVLGYSEEEIARLPPNYRDDMLHPDDLEYMQANRNMLHTLVADQVLEWRVRWQHKTEGWHWFNLRARVLSRFSDGRVKQVIGVVRDVTQQTRDNERLEASEQRYRLLAENITDVIWSTDPHFQLDYISPSVVHQLGYQPEQLIREGFVSVVADERYRLFMADLLRELAPQVKDAKASLRLRQEGMRRQITFDCIRADGHKCPIEMRISLMWGPLGEFLGLLGIARDISEQRRTENRLRMAATVFENTTGAIVVTDPAGYIVQVNANFTQITGYSAEDVIDQQPDMFIVDEYSPGFYRNLQQTLLKEGRWEGEVWYRRRSGEAFPSWSGINAVYDHEGDLVSYVSFFVDVSERKASEARIESLAYYDPLTGLPNRTLFQDRINSALQLAARRQEWVVVLFMDLDRFKPINDTLGHAAGDVMLKQVAQRLRQCVRESDTVARMGGDEFTLLLSGIRGREEAMSTSVHVAEKVLAALTPAFILQEREFFISASIGIALYPQDDQDAESLLKHADTAMYHAKDIGKNNFQFFQRDMNDRALERLALENDLRRALLDNAFTLHYQPQFDCLEGRLVGAEALLRWQHPQRGAVSPAVFVPIAEEIGLIGALGDWVLDTACRQLADWHAAGQKLPRLAINLSGRQFIEGGLVEQVAAALQRHAINPQWIELELTESILLDDVVGTMRTLRRLNALGVSIAVDDFGTGYSSLSYLKDFPIDTLKIDRSFIAPIDQDGADARLVEAIIALGRSLRLRVIAEGVETQAQLQRLCELDCDEVQGFYLGHPLPAERFFAVALSGP